jgi:hypothetical protein
MLMGYCWCWCSSCGGTTESVGAAVARGEIIKKMRERDVT